MKYVSIKPIKLIYDELLPVGTIADYDEDTKTYILVWRDTKCHLIDCYHDCFVLAENTNK